MRDFEQLQSSTKPPKYKQFLEHIMANKTRPRVAFYSKLGDIKSMIEAREFLKDIHEKHFPNGEISYRHFCYYVKELDKKPSSHSSASIEAVAPKPLIQSPASTHKDVDLFHSPTLQNRDEVY